MIMFRTVWSTKLVIMFIPMIMFRTVRNTKLVIMFISMIMLRTVRNTKLVIMFIWMLTTLLASPAILAHGLDSMSGPKEFYKYHRRFILTMFLPPHDLRS